jgi:hypothetical protein
MAIMVIISGAQYRSVGDPRRRTGSASSTEATPPRSVTDKPDCAGAVDGRATEGRKEGEWSRVGGALGMFFLWFSLRRFKRPRGATPRRWFASTHTRPPHFHSTFPLPPSPTSSPPFPFLQLLVGRAAPWLKARWRWRRRRASSARSARATSPGGRRHGGARLRPPLRHRRRRKRRRPGRR